ncbi:MAG: metallophosphoesterase family protein [Litorimonas sp.]
MNKIILGIGGTVCVIGGLSYAAASQTTPNTTALAAWSQYIDTDGIAGRFILDGVDKACSDFKFKDTDSTNTVAATQRNNPSKNGNTNDVDTDLAALFPVTVCQGTLGKTWETVEIVDSKNNPIQVNSSGKDENGNFIPVALTLPGPASVGKQHVDETLLVTLGDSGCQYTNTSDPRNRCDLTDWTFHDSANHAAGQKPDAILHVGDYRYHKQYSSDSWANWQIDFFRPGQKLLVSAPLIFVRGNHENCEGDYYSSNTIYSGIGFNYFLQANATSDTNQCSAHFRKANWTATFPTKTDSNGTDIPGHEIIIIDTAPDKQDASIKLDWAFLSAMKASSGKSAWWATHKPPVSLEKYTQGGRMHQDDDKTREKLVDALGNTTAPCSSSLTTKGCAPSLFLAGHEHFYQYIDFATEDMMDIAIVGNGGVQKHTKANLSSSKCTYFNFKPPFTQPSTQAATVESSSAHGYTVWHRTADSVKAGGVGWTKDPIFMGGSNIPPGSNQGCDL